jgi:hypothetical protein
MVKKDGLPAPAWLGLDLNSRRKGGKCGAPSGKNGKLVPSSMLLSRVRKRSILYNICSLEARDGFGNLVSLKVLICLLQLAFPSKNIIGKI